MIIVRLSGGMGNQMFQYSVGRALSLKYGVPLLLDDTFLRDRTPRPKSRHFTFRDYELDLFCIHAEIAKREDIPFWYRAHLSGKAKLALDAFVRKILRFRGTERGMAYDPKVLDLGPDAYLAGIWQSPSYFAQVADVIKKDFTLKAPLSELSQNLKDEILGCSSVCVNLRRGDFLAGNFHGTMGPDYYAKAVARMAEKNAIDKLYVFSDDIEWCEANLKFPYPTMFVGEEYKSARFSEYFELMRACRHFIISNSTFAWWAAWLSAHPDKTVIAPKRWFLDEKINTDDIIPSDWIRL